MKSSNVVLLSKRISWLLRHGAGSCGLAMDPAGWASVRDVLEVLGVTEAALGEAVRRNDKNRLEMDDMGRIRACQGHSLGGMLLTREALEASWVRCLPSAPLWHGTRRTAVTDILRVGINPGKRTHVHLAPSPQSRVGKRRSAQVLIEVHPGLLHDAGHEIFEASNGVLLVRYVPPDCITGVVAGHQRSNPNCGCGNSPQEFDS